MPLAAARHRRPSTRPRSRRRCARACRGEVRFDAGSRALYATDASNYRQVPIGVVVPRDDRRRGRRPSRSAARTARRPVARRRHQPRRAVLQRRGRDRLLEVHATRSSRSTRARASRASQPGVRARRPARARPSSTSSPSAPIPSTHSHCTLGGMIGNNSCGVHSLMAGQGPVRQRRRARHPAPTTARGCASAHDRDEELRARSSPRAAARARSTRGLRALRDRYADADPRALPEDSAPRLRLQPRRAAARERLPRRARAGRHRGHLRHRPRGDAAPGPQPAVRVAARARLSRRLRRPATTCRGPASSSRSASKGSTTAWSTT